MKNLSLTLPSVLPTLPLPFLFVLRAQVHIVAVRGALTVRRGALALLVPNTDRVVGEVVDGCQSAQCGRDRQNTSPVGEAARIAEFALEGRLGQATGDHFAPASNAVFGKFEEPGDAHPQLHPCNVGKEVRGLLLLGQMTGAMLAEISVILGPRSEIFDPFSIRLMHL